MARKSSIISPRNQGLVQGVPTPWQQPWTPGPALANLFALYPSLGDVTIAGATSLPSTLDGPIQVARYGALTVNAALTAANRCRGLVILADSLVKGAAGSISMTARGAAGSAKWANQDIGIPTNLILSGKHTSMRAFLQWLAETGYCIWDPTLFKCPPPGMGDVLADWADWPAKMAAIIQAASCGGVFPGEYCGAKTTGHPGKAGTNGGTGGGGGGGRNAASTNTITDPPTCPGLVWGGAAGQYGTGICDAPLANPDLWGGNGGKGTTGRGGGAGNPSGNSVGTSLGTGGVLIIIVRGDVTLANGHAFSANGMPGENDSANVAGGGGSGAGSVSLFYGGTLNGTPNMIANGGVGGTAGTGAAGGQGGVGSTQSKPFSAMGWAA